MAWLILMDVVVEREVVKQKSKLRGLTEDKAAGVDNDACLKLDLGHLDQSVSPVILQGNQSVSPVILEGAAVAADSARTLADIPEDYLMSASARTTARDELSVGDDGPLVQTLARSDVAQVQTSSHAASVTSQCADKSYSQDFSSAGNNDSLVAASQKPSEIDVEKHSEVSAEIEVEKHSDVPTEIDVEKHSEVSAEIDVEKHSDVPTEIDVEKHSEVSAEIEVEKHSEVSAESVETQDDISEVLSEGELSTSAVNLVHASSLSTSDKVASPSKPAAPAVIPAATAASNVAGNCCSMFV